MYKTKRLEYIREVFDLKYRIKNYDSKIKCKAIDKSYERLKDI